MVLKTSVQGTVIKALYESLNVDMMSRLANIVIPNYNLHERTGFPTNIPIPAQNAAQQIFQDIVKEDLFVKLVEAFIIFDREGFMGRQYPITFLRDIVKVVIAEGYVYDPQTKSFMEDINHRCTPNWSRLKEGQEDQFAFLRVDVVQNSQLVRSNEKEIVENAYNSLRDIIHNASIKRGGRIWSWEGDGGLIAFYFGQKNTQAVLAGIEILNEIFMYNQLDRKLPSPFLVRIACHTGLAKYYSKVELLRKNESINEIVQIESKFTHPDTFTISQHVLISLDRVLADHFKEQKSTGDWKLSSYTIRMEE